MDSLNAKTVIVFFAQKKINLRADVMIGNKNAWMTPEMEYKGSKG